MIQRRPQASNAELPECSAAPRLAAFLPQSTRPERRSQIIRPSKPHQGIDSSEAEASSNFDVTPLAITAAKDRASAELLQPAPALVQALPQVSKQKRLKADEGYLMRTAQTLKRGKQERASRRVQPLAVQAPLIFPAEYGMGSQQQTASKTIVKMFEGQAAAATRVDDGAPASKAYHVRKRSIGTTQKLVTSHVSKQLRLLNGADRLHPYVSQEAAVLMRAKLSKIGASKRHPRVSSSKIATEPAELNLLQKSSENLHKAYDAPAAQAHHWQDGPRQKRLAAIILSSSSRQQKSKSIRRNIG